MTEESVNDFGNELISWNIPEYEKHKRTVTWYIIASFVSIIFIIYSAYSHNYLFIILIILFFVINMVSNHREPEILEFTITTEGFIIGRNFYDFDDIKDFSIIYKPNRGVKTMYLNFNNFIRPRLSIPLEDINPVEVRDILLKYITEDLDRTNESNSDYIAKRLKL